MTFKRFIVVFIAITSLLALTAFSGNNGKQDLENHNNTEIVPDKNEPNGWSDSYTVLNYSSLAEVPKGLNIAENPKYEVGSKAIIEANHLPGMKGAIATIVGAYSTNAYAVSYTPTTGGKEVKNHKWVIQQEIKNAGSELLEPGTKVILEANHMKGMKGAKATIDFGEKTTVYMVDYTPTTGGKRVTNHKWLTESDLKPLAKNK